MGCHTLSYVVIPSPRWPYILPWVDGPLVVRDGVAVDEGVVDEVHVLLQPVDQVLLGGDLLVQHPVQHLLEGLIAALSLQQPVANGVNAYNILTLKRPEAPAARRRLLPYTPGSAHRHLWEMLIFMAHPGKSNATRKLRV